MRGTRGDARGAQLLPSRGSGEKSVERRGALCSGAERRYSGDRHDRYLQPELAEPPKSLATRGAQVVRHPNATHWVHWDEPEAVANALLAFLETDAERPRTVR